MSEQNPMISRSQLLANFVLFQLAWFACVLGGANGMPLAGVLAVVIAVAVHLTYCSDAVAELKLIMTVGLIGTGWDSLVVISGLMSYPSGNFVTGVAPYWIIAMWINFAATMNVSMNWLKGRLALAAVFGGLGGPLSYFAGYKLGGVEIPDLWLGLAAQGLAWAALMPLLTILAEKYNGAYAAASERSDDGRLGAASNV